MPRVAVRSCWFGGAGVQIVGLSDNGSLVICAIRCSFCRVGFISFRASSRGKYLTVHVGHGVVPAVPGLPKKDRTVPIISRIRSSADCS